ncbi:3'-Phosphadenosine 5'-phosphosulfate 3'-phosphatase [Sulfobacillus acidophilus TPY]|uniref:3'(2'),5'-bisphosphate nucleotidase CysQ n=1 Tax=Sulfobacillus acidophilus (strain ATCC 700253 / DSM 10332 / NAL) TaxID=679936 RepID=G8TYZ6_SULAD|nr:3'-Phosphadenosine 5'-phosphosulfate 3'-phosphatase [Sulfobacillus acidophilus TPY]AEW05175.1 3'(2'),5'-bisphosphate nucleotidase [Sulfobacillus acidophilus DSM 10332]
MNPTDWANRLEPALAAAERLILAVYERAEIPRRLKADQSPVTEADHGSSQILVEALRRLTPEIPVISEEAEWSGESVPRFWVIDPLDGTKEFIAHRGEFTMNLALIDGGKPVWGLIAVPLSGRRYVAWDRQAYRVEPDGSWHRLNPLMPPHNGLRVAASHSHPELVRAWCREQAVPIRELREAGSALKFVWMAEGEIDIYPRLKPTMAWDTAAGQVLVESLGGHVLRWPLGTSLTYYSDQMVNPSFVASTPGVPVKFVGN